MKNRAMHSSATNGLVACALTSWAGQKPVSKAVPMARTLDPHWRPTKLTCLSNCAT